MSRVMKREEKLMIALGIIVIILFLSAHYIHVIHGYNNIEISIFLGTLYVSYFLAVIVDLCMFFATVFQILLIILIVKRLIEKE